MKYTRDAHRQFQITFHFLYLALPRCAHEKRETQSTTQAEPIAAQNRHRLRVQASKHTKKASEWDLSVKLVDFISNLFLLFVFIAYSRFRWIQLHIVWKIYEEKNIKIYYVVMRRAHFIEFNAQRKCIVMRRMCTVCQRELYSVKNAEKTPKERKRQMRVVTVQQHDCAHLARIDPMMCSNLYRFRLYQIVDFSFLLFCYCFFSFSRTTKARYLYQSLVSIFTLFRKTHQAVSRTNGLLLMSYIKVS